MKKFLVVFLSSLLLLVGCTTESVEPQAAEVANDASSQEERTETESEANNTEAVEEEVVEETRTEFYINELVQFGDLVLSLNEVYDSEGSGFIGPDEGNKFVVLDLTIYNTGNENYSLSSVFGFELTDTDNYTYDLSWMAPTRGKLDGTILPGMKIRGEVAFEISKDSTPNELLFDYDLFSNGQLVFKLDPALAVEPVVFENPVQFTDFNHVADEITASNYKLVVNGAYGTQGSEYFGPEEGMKYVVIDASVENLSSEAETISTMLMFSLQTPDGFHYDEAIYTDAKGDLGGDIAPGRINRGEMAFEVPENATEFYLYFEPEVFEDEMYVVKIQLEE